MVKRIFGAALAALALTFGALTLATPAQATPQIELPWTVTFSPDDCSGLTKVTLTNNLPQGRLPGIGLVFTINGDEVTVDPDSSVIVDVVYPNSKHIEVDLTGAFDPDTDEPEAKSLAKIDTHWEHNWSRPAGCWKITVESHCNGDQALKVVNTAPDAAEVSISVDTTPAVIVPIAGNSTFTAIYHDQATVTVTVDKETTSTFPWVKPVCPSPVPLPQNPGNPDVLPVTGQSLQTEITVGSIALGLLVLGGVVLVIKRRRKTTTA